MKEGRGGEGDWEGRLGEEGGERGGEEGRLGEEGGEVRRGRRGG
jgi:hypothetical protein